jgi:mannose-1-phosphate guanylyltransferase/mannose-6-phosphate isomerase
MTRRIGALHMKINSNLTSEQIEEMPYIHPIIVAGGSGKRLWPLSRKSYPKQFSNIMGDETLFQRTAQRLCSSTIIRFAPQIIITNTDFRFIVAEQLRDIGIVPGSILLEPERKNTAAAILAASLFSYSKEKNAVLLISPSDHLMPDTCDFHEALKLGLTHVKNSKIVTFGIQPTYPETGYGYLQMSENSVDKIAISDVMKFVEKPTLVDAQQMLVSGNFLWNSGIFLCRAEQLIDEFDNHAPETLNLVSQAVNNAVKDLEFHRLASEPWSMLEDISIDYAIMEKTKNMVAVPYTSRWSDLGGWEAVWNESDKDKAGNVCSISAKLVDCSNSLVRAESPDQAIVGIGLDNIIAIAMRDAVLIACKDRAQDVKIAVDILSENLFSQVDASPITHRPWGSFESLIRGEKFQVKLIKVDPGEALSLQSHRFRSEHWIVVSGTAKVTINHNIMVIVQGESTFVPLGAIHRIENPYEVPIILVEVQIGTYLGEDDIERYEDRYDRHQVAN